MIMSASRSCSSAGIENWYGHDIVCMETSRYLAKIIPEIGANCIVLQDRINQMDLLRSPRNAAELWTHPEAYGIPILFLPNRIDAGKIVTASRVYQLPVTEAAGTYLHGFLHKSRWSVVDYRASKKEAHTVMEYSHGSDRKSYSFFPHKFHVVLHYTLSKTGLSQVITFTNEESVSFPFAIGCHTALRLPVVSGDDRADCRLLLSAKKRWDLDKRHLPTGKVQLLSGDDLNLLRGGMKVADGRISAHYSSGSIRMGKREFHGAILSNMQTGYTIEYTVDPSYRFWVLWNGGGGQGFVCPEPQTWAVNAPNSASATEETGMRLILPGEDVTLTSRLTSRTFLFLDSLEGNRQVLGEI